MNSCELAHLDGAYVLGALAPAERAAYERHLPGCEECSRALRDLAGLPGLLGKVSVEALEPTSEPEPVPATLLPAVVAEARRSRGRRTLALAVAAAVVLLVAMAGITAALIGSDDGGGTAAPTATESLAPGERLTALGNPSTGWVALTEKAWGTRIDLTCTYEGRLKGWTSYVLVVESTEGETEKVGSWRSEEGEEVHVTMATSVTPDHIKSVEVQTLDGYSVLRLDR